MKKYFLFPGQGSQVVGMGKELYAADPAARQRFDEACDILGFDLKKIMFEGPEDALKQTENTQPALFVNSYVIYEFFARSGVQADFAAGHSLGEYTAIAAAGGFDFTTGLKLVRQRGQLMSKATKGTMAAVMGADFPVIEKICNDIMQAGDIVVPANQNTPDQTVISGTPEGVKKASDALVAAGAKRVIPLQVSGAFHSPLMKEAAEQMKIALASAAISDMEIPVISNVIARPVSSGAEIRELLFRQLFSPVKWAASFEKAEAGVAVEMGPGKVLMGLLRKTNRNIQVVPAATMAEIDAALNAIGVQKA
jgi:[acyl-carrier-protein] S-malonyltransferase